MSDIWDKEHFLNEKAAFKYIESIIWRNGKVCPHCGNRGEKKIYEIKGERTRLGLHKCGSCRKQFTVRVGTIFESSHILLRKWLRACYLMSATRKGFPGTQLSRMIGVCYKTAWYLNHRIREAMNTSEGCTLGKEGAIVEVDETFFGKETNKKSSSRGWNSKNKILSLVERGGQKHSFHISSVNADIIKRILSKFLDKDTNLMTDEATWYKKLGKDFKTHNSVVHYLKEYVKDGFIHTNTIEGSFSIFKRGMHGIYQHCKSQHLKRYLYEFDFRYNHRHLEDENILKELIYHTRHKRLKYKSELIKKN